MKFYFKEIIIITIFITAAIAAGAQTKIVYAEDAVGKITGNETAGIFKRIDAVQNIDKAKASSLKNCLASQLKIFLSDPLFNPPKGFNTRISFGISKDPFAKTILFPSCSYTFNFYYLTKDDKTGATKVSMDGTLMGIETNAEDHFFRQIGNFWEDCSRAKFPLFFEQPPVSDSTADYIELNFKNYGYAAIAPTKPFRIIRRNDKPLFVPLTRKEFLQFLIAEKKYQVREDEKSIPNLQKNIRETQETLKNPPSYMTEEFKKALAESVSKIKKAIDDTKLTITNEQEKIKEYQSMIDLMKAEEAASPARLDEGKKTSGFERLNELVPIGRMEGVGLYKINPNYYDHSASASGAQLIFVYYDLPNAIAIENASFNYLQKKTINIFNQINYHQLKESMK
ncbi:MAG TPA: hypothetical protein VN722_05185 [Hanamia sp.]|nr:hypothetical protein [Hanamia sp.]